MKYLTFKGIAILAVALVPVMLRFKLHKIEVPKAKYPSFLAEAV